MHSIFSRRITCGMSGSTGLNLSVTSSYPVESFHEKEVRDQVFTGKKWKSRATGNYASNIQQLIARSAHEAVSWKIARENSEGTRRSRASRSEDDAILMRAARERGHAKAWRDEMLARKNLLHPFYRSARTHPVSGGPADPQPSESADAAFTSKVAFQRLCSKSRTLGTAPRRRGNG